MLLVHLCLFEICLVQLLGDPLLVLAILRVHVPQAVYLQSSRDLIVLLEDLAGPCVHELLFGSAGSARGRLRLHLVGLKAVVVLVGGGEIVDLGEKLLLLEVPELD